MALSAGGRWAATWSELKPLHEVTIRIGAFNPTGKARSPMGGKSPPGHPPSNGVAARPEHGHSGVHPHARRDGGASLTCARLAGRPPPGGRGGEGRDAPFRCERG